MKNRTFRTLINGLVLGATLVIGYISGSTLPTQAALSQTEINVVNLAKASTDMGEAVPFETYSKLMRVTACQYDGYTADVTFMDCMGFEYSLHLDDSDICVGDYFTCTLSNNGTAYIMDDIVLKIKYERVDLLMEATSYLDK